MTKKRSDQKRTRDVAAQQATTDSSIGYQITTLHGNAGTSRAYATLAGARRALASVRQSYPDAFIVPLKGLRT